MPCKRNKDLSMCKARGKVNPLGLKYFFRVYLWETEEAMHTASTEPLGEGCGAFCCHEQTWYQKYIPAGWKARLYHLSFGLIALEEKEEKCSRKRGELHFLAGKWTTEEVAHECLHASIGLAHAYHLDSFKVFDQMHDASPHLAEMDVRTGANECDEEMFCYIHGELMASVYKWLGEVDAHGKHATSQEAA